MWCCRLLCCLLVLMLTADVTRADESPSLEYQVKAAFLIKFGSFVEWPTDRPASREPFVIGILGKDPFGKAFDEAVKQERINGRPISVRRSDAAKDLLGCQIIFIHTDESARVGPEMQSLSASGILTIGESPDFARHLGVVGFIKENGKVRFEINAALAERSGLKISSKLLQVGKIVSDGRHKG
jgi:hypothetical protein